MGNLARLWRIVFAVIGCTAIAYQWWAAVGGGMSTSPLGSTVVYFSFFTTQTNVLANLIFLPPVLAPSSRIGRWAASEGVRAAVAMYIAVVGLVFHFILSATWKPEGLAALGNLVVHYIMPTAVVLDWLLFTPKGRLRWIDPVKWLAFPLLYGVWTVVHGQIIHWYPYFFIDIGRIGWTAALTNYVFLLAFFLIVGLVIVAIDRTFGRKHRRDLKAGSA
ncbi:Pr6Pr family membrane protein [soil metagenome]